MVEKTIFTIEKNYAVLMCFLGQKKLFRANPTPLHWHLIYFIKPQQFAAISNMH